MKALKEKLALLGVVVALVAGIGFLTSTVLQDDKDVPRDVPEAGSDTISEPPSLDTLDTTALNKLLDIEITSDNSVELLGEVNFGSVVDAIQSLKKKQDKEEELFLIITSPGGSVFAGAMLIETVQGSKTPINTICVGMCASMGAQIHAVGKKRYMTDKSVLMFHPASGGVQGEMETVQSRVNFITTYVNKMDAFVASRAQLDLREFKSLVRSELWLDARDATERKFNDSIVYINDKRNSSGVVQFLGNEEEKSKKRPSLGEDKFFNFR